MVNTGRRARNRAARNRQITEAASAILAEGGIDALTMQEVADRVDCAVGTIYTYFNSKSALLAALQSNAIRVLADSHEAAASSWEEHFEATATDASTAAVARLFAITELLLSWPELQPREFDFLQILITSQQKVIDTADAMSVAPQALTLFAEARVLIDAAVEIGVIDHDPDRPGDDSLSRTVRWMAATEGAVMVANAAALVKDLDPDAFDRHMIGRRGIKDLLKAWGASTPAIEAGLASIDELRDAGRLLPASI
jgi:AcrR family transcriptional regulator